MNSLAIYNSFGKKRENFRPQKNNISMYVCGPTVYGPSHLGHARTYIAFDFIRKSLEFLGYKVTYVNNITDIHDDIIKESLKLKKPFKKLSEVFSKAYFNDTKKLKIKPANKYPRVTSNIKEIIKLIQKLIDSGFAYRKDGSVYFSIRKFKDYGKLSNIKAEETKTGTRISTDVYSKENISDFVLWKGAKTNEPSWPSPFGDGRPGWHIECSAMSIKYLGIPIDIHGGGQDLLFPHHENEIAQSEAANPKKTFVKVWMHTGPLTINGQKMSKSLGNFITIPEILKKFSPEEIRYFILSTHYRSPIDFTEKSVNSSRQSLSRIHEFLDKLNLVKKNKESVSNDLILQAVEKMEASYKKGLLDDFNSPKMLAAVFETINILQPKLFYISKKQAALIFRSISKLDYAFNFLIPRRKKIPPSINTLLRLRELKRKKKDWEASDKLRKKLLFLGWSVEDTQLGPYLKKIER
ncbi:cysteine--tRNA ligase [Candidatus Parcubacteria bacterium]|nr:MAG: cysteine--tRNA ligase [Candidatus Parcubacteria bacterium]